MDCGCGRSPNGKCLGWHDLSEEEYLEKLKEYETSQKNWRLGSIHKYSLNDEFRKSKSAMIGLWSLSSFVSCTFILTYSTITDWIWMDPLMKK